MLKWRGIVIIMIIFSSKSTNYYNFWSNWKKKLFIDIDKGINSFNLCLSTWIFWSFNKGWSKANCLLISMQSTICPNSVYKFKKEKISSIIAWKQVLQHVIYEIKKKKTIIIISLPWFRQCLKNMTIVSCDREDR